MIITLDGPAGAGKSSMARALARRLGFRFLDTGAMYRAVTLAAMRRSIPWHDSSALAELARTLRIEFDGDQVLVDGENVTGAIRTTAVTAAVHHVADNPEVRDELVRLQRQAAQGRNIVCEGRDQGTIVFPDADCKIFLTASPEERARRRLRELSQRGEPFDFQEVLAQQTERDRRDATRPVGRLQKANDAREVVTDGLSPEEVFHRLVAIALDCQSSD